MVELGDIIFGMNKKLIGSIGAAILVIASGLIWYKTSGNGFETHEIKLQDVENVTTLVGTVKANQDLDLGFEVSGKIDKVLFTENEDVKAGDLIIELNKADLYAQRVQASANLRDAQSSLKQQEQQVTLEETRLADLKSGGSESEINVAKRNVELRSEELKKAKINLEEGLKDNVLDLENKLNETEVILNSSLNLALSSLYSLTELQLDNYPTETQESIRVAYHKARAAEMLLGISGAERYGVNILSGNYGGLVQEFENIDFDSTDTTLYILNKLRDVYSEINFAYLYFVIDDEFSEASISKLNSEKNTVNNEITNLNSQQQSILVTQRNIESKEVTLKANVVIAEKALSQANSELEKVKNGADSNDLRIQEIAIEQAKSQLESKKSRVQYEYGRIAAINADIAKRNIVSPIDGQIIDLNYAEGEIVSPGERVVTVQAENDLIIEIDSPERFISYIENGQEVVVVLDAFPSNTLKGNVVKVSKESTLVDNVPVFKVDISLDSAGLNVRSGMTGDVFLTLEKANQVIAVQATDLIKENEKTYVNKVTSLNPLVFEKTEIETGITGTNGLVEVVSGINVGDEILVKHSDD